MGVEIVLEIVYYLLVFVTSLCIGSFINVVIYRLPNKMSLVNPPSHCPNCNGRIRWYDNIPIISYLILGGKCRNCKEKISIRYLIVETTTALLAVLIYYRFGVNYLTLLSILVMFVFVAIFFIDAKHYEIPDSLNICIVLIGIISLFIAPINYVDGICIDYKDKLISILVVGFILLVLFIAEKITKKELMGGGDIKLMGAVGLFIGWQLMLLGVVFASILGSIVEISFKKVLNREKSKDGISNVLPFGPYLVIGFLISLLFGLNIISWYINLF